MYLSSFLYVSIGSTNLLQIFRFFIPSIKHRVIWSHILIVLVVICFVSNPKKLSSVTYTRNGIWKTKKRVNVQKRLYGGLTRVRLFICFLRITIKCVLIFASSFFCYSTCFNNTDKIIPLYCGDELSPAGRFVKWTNNLARWTDLWCKRLPLQ